MNYNEISLVSQGKSTHNIPVPLCCIDFDVLGLSYRLDVQFIFTLYKTLF